MLVFIGAMQIEVDAILNRMSQVQKKTISKTDFYQGKLAGIECLVMLSGVGKVASALSTTILFEHFQVSGVVNIGTAGGLVSNQSVLDVVVSKKVAHHDVDVPGWPKGFDQSKTCYEADPIMIKAIEQVVSDSKETVWFGHIVTGDCFVYRDEQMTRIQQEFPSALCAEMEGASIAQVCAHYGCPFVILRSLSDIIHKAGNEMTFDEYAEKASARSAKWCESFIRAYSDHKIEYC